MGFTLVELLVAATIALSVIAALANLFAMFSRTASDSQALVQMTSRLRSTAGRLRQDLAGVTTTLRPPLTPEAGAGYFELIEGPASDYFSVSGGTHTLISATNSILGDVDDVLLFTTRSTGTPFTGRFVNTVTGSTGQIESRIAEVAWFCRPSPVQPAPGITLHTLYRRQLLVMGVVGAAPFHDSSTLSPNNAIAGTLPAAYENYDLSLRPSGGALVPNSLTDLMCRENRFIPTMRLGGTGPLTLTGSATFDTSGARRGEDVILTNVIGFDIRVFDPDAIPLNVTFTSVAGVTSTSACLYPHEQRYLVTAPGSTMPASGTSAGVLATATAAVLSGTVITGTTITGTAPFRGCFLDLGCLTLSTTGTWQTLLTGSGNRGSGLAKMVVVGSSTIASRLAPATFDTWSTHYENNGKDDDLSGVIDQGTNGLDNAVTGGIVGLPDDPAEVEVPPPYASPLRAIEVRIRCYDPTSREIRQMTVRHQFRN